MHFLNRSFVHIALLAFVIVLIYSNTLTAPFEFDDTGNIVDNPAIRNIHYFFDTAQFEKLEILDSVRSILNTRYVGYLSFAANYAVHGLDVTGYHLVNILIHILNSVLLYLILQSTFRTPCFQNRNTAAFSADSRNFVALFTSLLFAVHPIQTQAVTFIVQRFASLAALFYLLSLLAYIRFRLDDSASIRRYLFYAVSLISTILAMKTKEFSLLLPLMIGLYEFTFFEGTTIRRLLHLIPYALTICIIPLSMSVAASNMSGANINIMTWDNYLYTQFRVIVTYLRLLVFPVNQNVDYDYPIYRSFLVPEVVLSFLFLLSILSIGIWLFRISRDQNLESSPWYRLSSCGIFWFFITAAPESSVIPIKDVIFEHRMYLPSIGFFLAMTICIMLMFLRLGKRFLQTRKIMTLFMFLLVVIFSVTAYARNYVWKDSVKLWEDIVRKSPNKPLPRYNLGIAYADCGRLHDAINSYNEVIRINYAYSTDVYNNLGLAYLTVGEVDQAIRVLEYISRTSIDSDIHFNLANAYMAKGQADKAVVAYKTALQRRPNDANFHFYLGVAYAKLGLNNEAINEYATVVRLRPDDVAVRNNLGNMYKRVGRVEEAMSEYLNAIRRKPDFAEAHFNLGNTYAGLGRMQEARNEYRITLSLKPDFIQARQQLEKITMK